MGAKLIFVGESTIPLNRKTISLWVPSRRVASLVAVAMLAFFASPDAQAFQEKAPSFLTNQQRFFDGKYETCLKSLEATMSLRETNENWHLLKLDCQMALGRYQEALATLEQALNDHPNSIRLRLAGYEIWKHNDDAQRARELLTEIGDLIQFRRWNYRDAKNQVAQGRYHLLLRNDAREILDKLLLPATRKAPDLADALLAIGDLGLAKHDYSLAADYYQRAVELQPENPAGFLGLAHAWRPSDLAKSSAAIEKTMELNDRFVPGLYYLIEDRIDSERYEDANAYVDRALKINKRDPKAWAYRAVLAHLANDPDLEAKARKEAFVAWAGNPEVDHIIGKKLSQKYRFAEGAKLQRRSLAYDRNFLPAKIQLANDLLRLGNEEGWKLADEVYEEDGYNVVAYNLVTLGENLSKYTVLQRDGFVVRMHPDEAAIYGEMVLDLLAEAKQELTKKYDTKIAEPIFIEIFPRQQDFAIRTFGLPGGSGYLGVCFGRVITMNSPKTQSLSKSNWKSVLWHEFCHVVTLQKTNNKMPRWLSEGISVYEEVQKDRSWGQIIDPKNRTRILGGKLTPVSQLSGAFLKAASGEDIQFAYFQSSLVVEYLIEEYGEDVLNSILTDLSIGMPINEALGRYTGDVRLLDKEFDAYAKIRAEQLAPKLDWTIPEFDMKEVTLEQWQAWNQAHPNNFYGLRGEAVGYLKAQQWNQVKAIGQKLIELYPDYRGADNGYSLLAKAANGEGAADTEFDNLKKSIDMQAAATGLNDRAIQMAKDRNDWAEVSRQAERWLAINPLIAAPHRAMAEAAEKTGDHAKAAASLSALTRMNPFDPADTLYRYAAALKRNGQFAKAKRAVLKCLEQAPRYRDAHKLLLELSALQQQSEESEKDTTTKDAK